MPLVEYMVCHSVSLMTVPSKVKSQHSNSSKLTFEIGVENEVSEYVSLLV